MFVLINKTSKKANYILGHVISRHKTAKNAYKAGEKAQPKGNAYIPYLVAEEVETLSKGEMVGNGDVRRLGNVEAEEAWTEACAELDPHNIF